MKMQLRTGKHKVSLSHVQGPPTAQLGTVSRLIPLPESGPEDVILADDRHPGQVYLGTLYGGIYRTNTVTGRSTLVCNTGGRPLGLELTRNGDLIICDSLRGLLRQRLDTQGNPSGDLEELVTNVAGKQLKFCSNAAEAPDGSIWFTESTDRYHCEEYMGSILEHRASGSLNVWHPDGETGSAQRVLSGLFFANGLVIEPNGSGLLLCETTDYALRRVAGGVMSEKIGQSPRVQDVATNLPGFPDNMSTLDYGPSGDEAPSVWVAFAHPRSWLLDLLAKLPAVFRHAIWNIPDAIRPGPEHEVWLVKCQLVDGEWKIVEQIRGTHPDFHTPTGAVRVGGELVVASKDQPHLLVIDLDKISADSVQ